MNLGKGESFAIQLVGGPADEMATFEISEAGEECRLRCVFRGQELIATESDWFEAMCTIRIQLEKYGLIPDCYAASLNVWPSGMARDMGGGLKAYRLSLGRPAVMADLVEIFDREPNLTLASVEQQQAFFEQWLQSLGS